MNDSSIRIDSKATPASSTLSLPPERKESTSVSSIRSSVDVAEQDVGEERESDGEESTEHEQSEERAESVESEPSYEEYEEEVEGEDGAARRQRARSADSPRRALSLIERWQEWQRVAAAVASRSMPGRGKKGRKGEKSLAKEEADVADGVSDADDSAIGAEVGVGVGVGDTRERMIKDLREEIQKDQYYENQKAILEREEAANRQRQLEDTIDVLHRHWSANAENALNVQREENWARYMTCDGLPDPGSLPDTNTFLFLWSMKDEEATMDTVEEKCRVVTNLLRKIDRVGLADSAGIVSKEYAAECENIAAKLRAMLQRWIDLACYRLLRNIEANTIREDTKTTRYVSVTSKAVCCVWVPIALPVGMKRPGAERDRSSVVAHRKSVQVDFEDIRLTIKLPSDHDVHRTALRGLWLAYDHYSIESDSYRMPHLPDEFLDTWDSGARDLLRFAIEEHEERLRIREEQAEERRLRLEEKKAMLERMENPPIPSQADRKKKRGKKQKKQQSAHGKQSEFDALMEGLLLSRTDLLPYLPTPSEIVRQREEEARSLVRRSLFIRCEKTEVNLRKYRILGGVFRVDLLYQPPQPKDLGRDTSLTTLQLPKEPRFVPFFRPYEPPRLETDSERTPEVIEAETKALEMAMEALVLLTLKLPESVFWFEPPLIAHWLPEKKIWSTKDVHDVKFNEEKQTVAFRSGRLGVHGLAAYKYANFPFQSWELKPETGKNAENHAGVVLVVAAATVQAEFVVRDDLVCLNSFTGASTAPLKGILGEYFELETLVERLQQVGCDLFPERDVASYLKGLSVKHPIAERHLRECMALLSTSYAFSWSRWNASRDFREIVLLFKELHGCVAKERANQTLLVTPLRAMRVRCTEVSPEFSDLPLEDEDTEFYADLYQLALNTAGIKSRLLMAEIPYKLVTTVTRLLERTNVIDVST